MMHCDTFYLILDFLILIIIYYLLLKGLGLQITLLFHCVNGLFFYTVCYLFFNDYLQKQHRNFPSCYNTIPRKGILILKITDQTLLQH